MVFSFFRPSFDKLYARAMASDDPQTILKHLKEALKAAGNDLDKSGVALFSIGDVLLQLGTATNQAQLSERGRTSTAQGLTMVKRERQQHLAPKAAAALGLPSTMPLDDLVAACWEVDSLAKLREGDIQGCVTAMQQATAQLSAAYGKDNPRMLGPLWRCMARLMGTSASQLATGVAQIGAHGVRILDQHKDAPIDDALWVLNYAAAAAAMAGTGDVKSLLQRTIDVATAGGRDEFAAKAQQTLASLSSSKPSLRFSMAEEELTELRHNGAI